MMAAKASRPDEAGACVQAGEGSYMRRVSAGVSVLVGFLLLLAACAPPGVPVADPNYDAQGKRFEAPSQGMAALYIANVDRPNSGAPPLTVSIGPRQLGTLANSTWYRVELAPGTYDVRATDNNSAGRHYVSLWPGEMRFLIAYVRAGGAVDVGQVSKEEGQQYVLGGQRARASE